MNPRPSIISMVHKNISLFTLVILCGLALSCNQRPRAEITSLPLNNANAGKAKFTRDMVNNKKDPSCGMPLTAGIHDTVHYNGKVYGFCSDECKQIFLKDPKTLAKNADMK